MYGFKIIGNNIIDTFYDYKSKFKNNLIENRMIQILSVLNWIEIMCKTLKNLL